MQTSCQITPTRKRDKFAFFKITIWNNCENDDETSKWKTEMIFREMVLRFRTFTSFVGDYSGWYLLIHVRRNFRSERARVNKLACLVSNEILAMCHQHNNYKRTTARHTFPPSWRLKNWTERQECPTEHSNFFFSRPNPNVSRLWRPGAARPHAWLSTVTFSILPLQYPGYISSC